MNRELASLSVTYTYTDPEKANYQRSRRMNNVDPNASDQQIWTVGQVLATLVPGEQLVSAVLQSRNRIH